MRRTDAPPRVTARHARRNKRTEIAARPPRFKTGAAIHSQCAPSNGRYDKRGAGTICPPSGANPGVPPCDTRCSKLPPLPVAPCTVPRAGCLHIECTPPSLAPDAPGKHDEDVHKWHNMYTLAREYPPPPRQKSTPPRHGPEA
ncbi:hypothetical protein HPB49_001418 [Dermacentor silvarum]|uniref:Uncharacterized protein n=1 Tax=Dermacentor silvarum TaxID=543639 RepID=A0ACB8C6P5_DERSI|nr:hypothetical protein HPB49_001418 [Dermacentor silvarum]